MKKILISIRPEFVKEILNGNKLLEARLTMPKCDDECEVHVYCTKSKPIIRHCVGYNGIKNNIKYVISLCDSEDELKHICGDYATNGKVVAKFIMRQCFKNNIAELKNMNLINPTLRFLCLSEEQLLRYVKNDIWKPICLWCIDDLEIFSQPKTLADYNIKRAPQSWCYIKE